MPSGPIIDSHVHLWDPGRFAIPWLESVPRINRPFGLDDYSEATAGLDVRALVYLQVEVAPVYALLEARDLAALSERDPRIAGIVPWAPLEHGATARYYLEELVKLGPKIKGIRRIVQDEPDPQFCLAPRYVEATKLLPEFGLSSDLCCTFRQLGAVVEHVRQCPEVSFILDHIAKPNIRGQETEPWMRQMRELASMPNVYCKISGVVTEANHNDWTMDEIRPYVLHALEVFGEDRVVFGSDWPVATLAASYRRWVETLDELTSDLTDAARHKLWYENARRFYRLDLPEAA